MEDEGYDIMCGNTERRPFIYNVTDKPCCLTWWAISLVDKGMINDCEVMSTLSSLVCKANYLKVVTVYLKRHPSRLDFWYVY